MLYTILADNILEIRPENKTDREAIAAHWPGTDFHRKPNVRFTVKAVTAASRPLPLWLQAFNWKDL